MAIRLAELQEALLTYSAVQLMLARQTTPQQAVDIVMEVMERIVHEKRESRAY